MSSMCLTVIKLCRLTKSFEFIRNMAIILKDFNHVTVVEGELVPSTNCFDLEDLLGNFDYKRIIKMQFDRLDSSFQELLTVSKYNSILVIYSQ